MFLNIFIVLVLAVCAIAAPTPAFNGTSLQAGDSTPSEAPSHTLATPIAAPQTSSPAPIVPILPNSPQSQLSPFSRRSRPPAGRLARVPSTGPREISAYLSAHNSVRAAHGASPLTWSSDLAQVAQTWANRCEFRHSDGELGPYGENLAAGAGYFPVQNAVNLFINEPYDAATPTFSHFTQVVWKSTTQLGCAVALCDGIFDPKYGKATYHVCMYNPVGNIVGEEKLNVQA